MESDAMRPAVSVALLKGDMVLLVRRAREPSRGLYAFPGGRVEPGETLEQAARRELMEETGLAAGALTPVARYLFGSDDTGFDLQVFAGPYTGGEPQAADDAEDARFVRLADMEEMAVIPSVLEVAQNLLGSEKILAS
jgi:ADP-ribose pyrophosphatase YjhB (NUDIX family)